ncbi:MAG: 6-phosphofructokinase [Verrucomicrobiae bacterium]|nr:6-phosphofructokinase [Verrucomicrobiae bacterium]
MTAPKRIGILTGGGDCPGLNAVIRAAVRVSTELGWEIYGFHDGYEGLLEPDGYTILDRRKTSGIMQLGGTILGTTNRGRFASKVGHGEKAKIPDEILATAKRNLHQLQIDALICIGGDGSLATAQQLFEAGIPVVGVPKTIDNDISATATSFGFDSACACVADSLDRLHTTARSHRRVMVVETMGRYAGWIALHGGLAGGADIILIPEIPFHYDYVARAVQRRMSAGYRSTMIVVAEGATPEGQSYVTLKDLPQAGEKRLGGISLLVAEEISKRVHWETRAVVLAHLQRGGNPTALDRILGTRFGVAAVELIYQEKYGHMVSYQGYQIGSVSIAEAINQPKLVPPDGQVVQGAKLMGISFGDEDVLPEMIGQ